MRPFKVIISLLYRPPNAPHASFQACLDKVRQYFVGHDDYDVCLLGDYNFPNIQWDPVTTTFSTESSSALLDFMSEHLLSQYVLQPTRKDKVLDLFITNSPSLVTHVSTSDTKLSDHRLVEIFLSYNLCQPNIASPPSFETNSFRSLDFTKGDFVKINNRLSTVNWAELSSTCDEEEFPERVTQVLLEACQEGCPLKVPPRAKKGSRLLHTLSRKKRKLQSAFDAVIADPLAPSSQIDSLRRRLSLLHYDIRDAIINERRFKEEQAVGKVKSNTKYFYSYAKQFSKQKQSISMLYDECNNICTNTTQIEKVLQKQFVSVFSDPSVTDVSSASNFNVPKILHPHSDDDIRFTTQDIMDAIDDIKPHAAPGPDEIPPIVLKQCKEQLATPIHLIWSRSLASGSVPKCYKRSLVTPLYKKGSRALPSNYRPVSLTSHVIKLYERVVRKQLVTHITSNNLMCRKQHGFQAGKSCLTQLLDHIDKIISNFQSGLDTDCIYLDFSKAFDKVDHALLLKKLEKYGVHPQLIRWIKSFLTDRSQQVVLCGQLSLAAIIISGVPQGTVLGPILFLIFINDITGCITHSTIRCFADDTKISKAKSCEADMAILQADLDTVTEWSSRNNMQLYKDKFEYVCHVASKTNTFRELPFVNEIYQYSTSKGPLEPVNQPRDLGVIICPDLSWTSHISTICNKSKQKAAWVLSVFHSRSPMVMLTLYKSLVRSLLEYCSPLWNPSKVSDIQQLESVQKTFTSRIGKGFKSSLLCHSREDVRDSSS